MRGLVFRLIGGDPQSILYHYYRGALRMRFCASVATIQMFRSSRRRLGFERDGHVCLLRVTDSVVFRCHLSLSYETAEPNSGCAGHNRPLADPASLAMPPPSQRAGPGRAL
jgi:hypothetical protein